MRPDPIRNCTSRISVTFAIYGAWIDFFAVALASRCVAGAAGGCARRAGRRRMSHRCTRILIDSPVPPPLPPVEFSSCSRKPETGSMMDGIHRLCPPVVCTVDLSMHMDRVLLRVHLFTISTHYHNHEWIVSRQQIIIKFRQTWLDKLMHLFLFIARCTSLRFSKTWR